MSLWPNTVWPSIQNYTPPQQGSGLLNNPATTQQQRNQMAAQYNRQLWQNVFPKTQWVFNGESMSITEFAQAVYGDTPERTAFLLRYAGK